MKNRDSYVARRRFLCGMVGGGAVALGAAAVGPMATYVTHSRPVPLPEFAVIAAADCELGPGEAKMMRYGPAAMLLFRTPEPAAELRIFLAKCTHLDCLVGYQPDEDIILCACHDGKFDLEGNVISGPPPAPLNRVYHNNPRPGEDLVVALEEENLAKAFEQSS